MQRRAICASVVTCLARRSVRSFSSAVGLAAMPDLLSWYRQSVVQLRVYYDIPAENANHAQAKTRQKPFNATLNPLADSGNRRAYTATARKLPFVKALSENG